MGSGGGGHCTHINTKSVVARGETKKGKRPEAFFSVRAIKPPLKKADNHQAFKGVYVLTLDLGMKIKSLRHMGLKTPGANDSFFRGFQSELAKKIRSAFPGGEIKVVMMEELAERITAKAFEKSNLLKNAVVVSSCLEISSPHRGHTLEINRIVDINGSIIGLGSRPGHPALDEQINGIASLAARQPLVLVEDGSFSGKTMRYVLHKFKQRKMNVAAVVIGFAFPHALEEIRKEFFGDILVIEEMKDIIDWMPDHDFLPFSPNCGRTFGVSVNGGAFAFYTHEGASYSIPYILPFAPMTEWTSIPQEHVNDISVFCLQQAEELFRILDRMNKTSLRIGDLIGARTRVSVPMCVGQKRFPQIMEMPIVDFIKDLYKHGIIHFDVE